jgi:hypothetical protein
VDAAAFACNGIAGRIERFVSDQQRADERRLQRTAKSCGPDAPTLASSSRMLCRPQPGADKTSVRGRRWQESPVTEESTKETVKTIACGNAGRFRCTRCCSCAFYHSKCTRDRGCSGHPAFPTPSLGAKDFVKSSGATRREDEVVSETTSTSLRAQRSNPFFLYAEIWIASSLRSSQ